MRISDWSSDVCSSDILVDRPVAHLRHQVVAAALGDQLRYVGLGVAEIAEMPGRGRAGRDAGGYPVDLVEVPVVDAVDAERALLHRGIGGAHVVTPVTSAQLRCRSLLEKKVII